MSVTLFYLPHCHEGRPFQLILNIHSHQVFTKYIPILDRQRKSTRFCKITTKLKEGLQRTTRIVRGTLYLLEEYKYKKKDKMK